MADKIKKSYKFSKKFYDDALTQSKWWSRLYFRLLWGGTNDNKIARRVLDWIPDDFDGKLLDVPIGTAVFTADKYKRMTKAQITGLDYSTDMLERAQERLSEAGIGNVKLMQGDVGALPFPKREDNGYATALSAPQRPCCSYLPTEIGTPLGAPILFLFCTSRLCLAPNYFWMNFLPFLITKPL